jgi:EAL domain-containing protein (putative c-di-GMP-specific phosphodiesterase class I)
VLISDAPQVLALLGELRRLGVRVAMDDFGTGFSSLSYLRSFAFDRIKIDRSFLHNIEHDADARAIIRAVTGLGRSLGMQTTVEGVETLAQLHAARTEGGDEVQGYLFSWPRPAADVPALILSVGNAARDASAAATPGGH